MLIKFNQNLNRNEITKIKRHNQNKIVILTTLVKKVEHSRLFSVTKFKRAEKTINSVRSKLKYKSLVPYPNSCA
jgi:hypothetical protein